MTPEQLQVLIEDATFDFIAGDSAAALEKLGRATTACPQSEQAWHATSEILFRERRLDEALEAAQKALSLSPDDALVLATLSRIWMERGDKAKAEHFVAAARIKGWKEELKEPPANAGGLH